MIERVGKDFCQKYSENPMISEISFSTEGDFTIILRNGDIKKYSFPIDAIYVGQYSIPLTEDGKTMYIGGWYQKDGLQARDTMTGKLVWKMKTSRIRNVYIFHDYGIALREGDALIRFDPQTGDVKESLKGSGIDQMFLLRNEEALVFRYKRMISIIDLSTFQIIRRIPDKLANPYDCLSYVVQDARMEGDLILLTGFERYAYGVFHPNEEIQYFRRFIQL